MKLSRRFTLQLSIDQVILPNGAGNSESTLNSARLERLSSSSDEAEDEDCEDVNSEGVQSIRRAVLARQYMMQQMQRQHQFLLLHQHKSAPDQPNGEADKTLERRQKKEVPADEEYPLLRKDYTLRQTDPPDPQPERSGAVLKWLAEAEQPPRINASETEEDAPISSVSTTHCERLYEAVRAPPVSSKPRWVRLVNSNPGQSLGIQIKPLFREGREPPRKPDDIIGIEVHSIMVGGRVDREGCLKLGDQIFSINDTSLTTLPFERSRSLFQKALSDQEVLLLVKSNQDNPAEVRVLEEKKKPEPPKRSPQTNLSVRPPSESPPPIPTECLLTQQSPNAQFLATPLSSECSCGRLEISLKKSDTGLGFSLTSRSGLAILVKSILPGGAALKDGRLKQGDQLLSVDGADVDSLGGQTGVVAILREKPTDSEVNLVVCRCFSREVFPLDIKLPAASDKDSISLGVCIRVKRALEEGEKNGVFVRNVIPGGAAHKDGRLRIGDRLLAVGEEELSGLSPKEALTVLKKTISKDQSEGKGVVRLLISRQEERRRRYTSGTTTGTPILDSPVSASVGATVSSADEIEELPPPPPPAPPQRSRKTSASGTSPPPPPPEVPPPVLDMLDTADEEVDNQGKVIVAAVVHSAILETTEQVNANYKQMQICG
ncbi:Partitioning defective 3 [Cichlidogyrus casuarinus]|uniref:Partitioning defective 3 n=1 Tax=Cichlidogyrus casuarinus TaxID=1844966 RepID=A0ABD2Q1A7_9PLAT